MSVAARAGVPVVLLSGRSHRYEGYTLDRVTFAACLRKAWADILDWDRDASRIAAGMTGRRQETPATASAAARDANTRTIIA